MESYGSIGSPDGNRINRKHLSPYGPGQWMRWRWVAPGKGGIHHWCQSFLLNLEALESLEARNCDANFQKKKTFSSKCWKSSSTDLPKSSSLSVDQRMGQKNDVLTPCIPIRYW